MNAILIVISVSLPLLPLVLFPAKTIGRGGVWTIVGAAMIVGVMMLIFFGMQELTGDAGSDDLTAASAQISDADVKALEKLLQ